jgi:U3 small nucleolar ribonucleoprotein component
MADELDNVAPAYIPGTEEVYRELSRKADLLRRGQLSEDQVASAFDEIVGTLDDAEGFVPAASGDDPSIEATFAQLEKQARELQKQAQSTNLDVDKQLDYMTRDAPDMDTLLAGLDDIKF